MVKEKSVINPRNSFFLSKALSNYGAQAIKFKFTSYLVSLYYIIGNKGGGGLKWVNSTTL